MKKTFLCLFITTILIFPLCCCKAEVTERETVEEIIEEPVEEEVIYETEKTLDELEPEEIAEEISVPQVNLKEIGDKLWDSTSFTFDFIMNEPLVHFQGEWVRAPWSWHISKVEKVGGTLLTYITIGEQEWAILV